MRWGRPRTQPGGERRASGGTDDVSSSPPTGPATARIRPCGSPPRPTTPSAPCWSSPPRMKAPSRASGSRRPITSRSNSSRTSCSSCATDGLVASQRGADGGYRLARPPEEITLAEVIRAVDGPLANVRGARRAQRPGRAAQGRLDRGTREPTRGAGVGDPGLSAELGRDRRVDPSATLSAGDVHPLHRRVGTLALRAEHDGRDTGGSEESGVRPVRDADHLRVARVPTHKGNDLLILLHLEGLAEKGDASSSLEVREELAHLLLDFPLGLPGQRATLAAEEAATRIGRELGAAFDEGCVRRAPAQEAMRRPLAERRNQRVQSDEHVAHADDRVLSQVRSRAMRRRSRCLYLEPGKPSVRDG